MSTHRCTCWDRQDLTRYVEELEADKEHLKGCLNGALSRAIKAEEDARVNDLRLATVEELYSALEKDFNEVSDRSDRAEALLEAIKASTWWNVLLTQAAIERLASEWQKSREKVETHD